MNIITMNNLSPSTSNNDASIGSRVESKRDENDVGINSYLSIDGHDKTNNNYYIFLNLLFKSIFNSNSNSAYYPKNSTINLTSSIFIIFCTLLLLLPTTLSFPIKDADIDYLTFDNSNNNNNIDRINQGKETIVLKRMLRFVIL